MKINSCLYCLSNLFFKHSPDPAKLAAALSAFECALGSFVDSHDGLLELLGSLQEPCLDFGGAASAQDPAFFLAFAKHLAAPGAPDDKPFRPFETGHGILASCLPTNWFLLGALRARPELARARNERGHCVLSLFNESLACDALGFEARGWTQATHALSEACAVEMLQLGADPMLLVALPNPVAIAATPALRAAAERVAIESGLPHAPSRANPRL